jgi:hypothetical protein
VAPGYPNRGQRQHTHEVQVELSRPSELSYIAKEHWQQVRPVFADYHSRAERDGDEHRGQQQPKQREFPNQSPAGTSRMQLAPIRRNYLAGH